MYLFGAQIASNKIGAKYHLPLVENIVKHSTSLRSKFEKKNTIQ